MEHTSLSVSCWVAIQSGCPISYEVLGSGDTHFLWGTACDGFEFDIEADALREFIELGSKALAEMDARYAAEEAQEDAEGDPSELAAGAAVRP